MTTTIPERGSARLREAWKNRALTDEAVESIATALDESRAAVEAVSFTGGERPSAVTVGLSYEGDDVPICGNDLLFWLQWHKKFGGGVVVPPTVIVNGTPHPEIVKLLLTFGEPTVEIPAVEGLPAVGGFGR